MTTGKTNSPLTFVGKVMSLLFNMLSRLVIAFLPRSKRKYWCASFYCDSLYCTLQMLHFFFLFYKWKVCGNCFEQVYWWHSPPPPCPVAFAHLISLCHILVILTIFQKILILFVMVICDASIVVVLGHN